MRWQVLVRLGGGPESPLQCGTMPLHFDCVFYYVSEMGRAIHFSRDVLGLRFVSRDVAARFDLDGVLFGYFHLPARE